jgi:hypothetical protein
MTDKTDPRAFADADHRIPDTPPTCVLCGETICEEGSALCCVSCTLREYGASADRDAIQRMVLPELARLRKWLLGVDGAAVRIIAIREAELR